MTNMDWADEIGIDICAKLICPAPESEEFYGTSPVTVKELGELIAAALRKAELRGRANGMRDVAEHLSCVEYSKTPNGDMFKTAMEIIITQLQIAASKLQSSTD